MRRKKCRAAHRVPRVDAGPEAEEPFDDFAAALVVPRARRKRERRAAVLRTSGRLVVRTSRGEPFSFKSHPYGRNTGPHVVRRFDVRSGGDKRLERLHSCFMVARNRNVERRVAVLWGERGKLVGVSGEDTCVRAAAMRTASNCSAAAGIYTASR